MTNSFANWLIERDIFGQPIEVLYKGSNKFKTWVGTLCTFLTYILLLLFVFTQTTAYWDRSKQEVKSQRLLYDRYEAGEFNLAENHVNLRMGTTMPIPESIGRLVLKVQRQV